MIKITKITLALAGLLVMLSPVASAQYASFQSATVYSAPQAALLPAPAFASGGCYGGGYAAPAFASGGCYGGSYTTTTIETTPVYTTTVVAVPQVVAVPTYGGGGGCLSGFGGGFGSFRGRSRIRGNFGGIGPIGGFGGIGGPGFGSPIGGIGGYNPFFGTAGVFPRPTPYGW